jgi:hypothetical protein
MATSLQDLIDAAEKLSPLEKLDLINALSRSLQHNYAALAEFDSLDPVGFWKPQPLEKHLQLQRTPVVGDIAELRADFWPEDESSDDLIEYVYRQREKDRLN